MKYVSKKREEEIEVYLKFIDDDPCLCVRNFDGDDVVICWLRSDGVLCLESIYGIEDGTGLKLDDDDYVEINKM